MLRDEDKQVRKISLNKILAIRRELQYYQVVSDAENLQKVFANETHVKQVDNRAISVRRFQLPKIN